MTFDPNKPTDVEAMTSGDYTVWRTGKQNEVRFGMISSRQMNIYIQLRSLPTPLEDRSTSPLGP